MKDEEKAMSAKNRSRLRLQNPETAEPSKTKDLRDAIIFDRTQPNPDTRLSDKETPPSQKLKEAIIFNNLEDTEKSCYSSPSSAKLKEPIIFNNSKDKGERHNPNPISQGLKDPFVFNTPEDRERFYNPNVSLNNSIDTVLLESSLTSKEDSLHKIQLTVCAEEDTKTEIDLSKAYKKACSVLDSHPDLHPADTAELDIQPQIQTIASLEKITREDPSAYLVARELAKQIHLFTLGDDIYMYCKTHYRRVDKRTIKRLIVKNFRNIFETGGGSRFRQEVVETILDDPEFVKNGINVNSGMLSFLNCVVDLKNGNRYQHDPKWITTYAIQCSCLEGLFQTPTFDRFLMDITGGDQILATRIWQMIGYVLSPDTQGKVFFLLQGVPDSGKTILSSLLESFFEKEAAITLDIHDLSDRFAVSDLREKALCLSPDLSASVVDARAVSKIKQLTGGDTVTSDQKFKSRISFRCTAKFVLGTNHVLIPKGDDKAFFNRAVVIPFQFSIPREHQDHTLLNRLVAERDGIATRAVYAYRQLVRDNYQFAGNYELNAVVTPSAHSEDLDLDTSIYNFIRENYEADTRSAVLISDAHGLFEKQYIQLSDQQFTPRFVQFAQQLFGAHKERLRNGFQNARYHVVGIRSKQNEISIGTRMEP